MISDKVHFHSMKGHRDQNEDAHDIILNMDGGNPEIKNINLYCIYDGHAGKDVSAFLRDNLSKPFINKNITYPLKSDKVIEECNKIQEELKKKPYSKNMGSTALLVAHYMQNGENYLNIINCGDSRAIIERNGFGMPLTKDHKPGWPEEYKRISLIGGKVTFSDTFRIDNLSVSRSFGDTSSAPFVTHVPEVFKYKIDKNDKFMVLTCDGTIEVMDTQEIVNFVLTNCYDMKTKKRLPLKFNIAKKLADHAFNKGSQDNISIIVVFFN